MFFTLGRYKPADWVWGYRASKSFDYQRISSKFSLFLSLKSSSMISRNDFIGGIQQLDRSVFLIFTAFGDTNWELIMSIKACCWLK